jgi:NADPH-dependent 2,4-dienoyl-CoA reductase/sulfur reductase-like enzyme
MKLLIIGGSDAGISAALRAREMDSSLSITILLRDEFPNYSICGIPFFLSGETPDFRSLAHRGTDELQSAGIELKSRHRALTLNPKQKKVLVRGPDGQTEHLPYDRLIVATGAQSILPPIMGLQHPGVFKLRWMGEALELSRFLKERKPRQVTIIGAGYLGLEMADALTRLGMEVSLIQRSANVLKTLDSGLSILVKAELERNGVRVLTGHRPEIIEKNSDKLKVFGSGALLSEADFILVTTGANPLTDLAAEAGADTGIKGALKVDRYMRTNLPDVLAAGDCVETWHRLLKAYTYLPLGTTAHKQGRIAGENAVGGQAVFPGSLGTQVVKVFDLVVARTGLKDREALEAGFKPITVEHESWDHKAYYPGAAKLIIRLTGDRESGRLLGAQILGPYRAEISKRIDLFAAALYSGLNVENLLEMDLSYTPPLSNPWDPVQTAAQFWTSSLNSSPAD